MFNYKDTFDKTYIKHHSINELNNFISGYFIDEKKIDVCDDLMDYYVHDSNKTEFYGNQACELDNAEISKKLDEQLFVALTNYAKTYPCSVINLPGIVEKCVIQSSEDGKSWNSIETVTITKDIRKRHFGFLLFLSDVSEGGSLVFHHQKIKITPKKGLVVIYPDNWQFVYSIEPSNKELFWLSGHISNITEDEKIDATRPKLKMLSSDDSIGYKFIP